MLLHKNLTRHLLLGLLLVVLALSVFTMALDGAGLVDSHWPPTVSAYFSDSGAESTDSPIEIAGCNGGSSGSCGGG